MFSNILLILKRFFSLKLNNTKLSTYLGFFIISFLFWFLSMLSKKHETTIDANIKYINLPVESVIDSQPVNQIKIRVRAPGFAILFYNIFSDIILNMDFSIANSKYINDDQEKFWIMNSQRKRILNDLGSSFEIISIEPERLSVILKNKFNKKVPVLLQNNIGLMHGFRYKDLIKIKPDSIVIYGKKDILDTIGYIKSENIVFSKLNKDLVVETALEKKSDVQYSCSNVSVIISVEPFVEEKVLKEIIVDNLNEGYILKTFPKKIEVTVRVPKSSYTSLSTDFFKVSVDAKDITSESNTLEIMTTNLSPDIQVQRLYPERVEYLLIKE